MPPRLRQGKLVHGAGGSGFGGSFAITFDSNVVVGNTIALMCGIGNIADASLITGCTDNLGNTYTERADNIGGGDTKKSFTAPVTVAGACTITITCNTDQGWRNITAQEIEGVDSTPTSVRDLTAISGSEDGHRSGSVIAADMNGIYIFGAMYYDNVPGAAGIRAGVGFTLVERFDGDGDGAPCAHEWKIINPKSSQNDVNARFSITSGGDETTVFELVFSPLEAVPGVGINTGNKDKRFEGLLTSHDDEGRFNELNIRNWF